MGFRGREHQGDRGAGGRGVGDGFGAERLQDAVAPAGVGELAQQQLGAKRNHGGQVAATAVATSQGQRVQLLGPTSPRKPRDMPEGYLVAQSDLAAEAGVPILQWRSPDLVLDTVVDPAHRAFLAHRKAKKQGLIRSVAATAANCTNDFAPAPAPEPAPANRTNDFAPARRLPEPDPLAALRARIQRLLAGTETPDPDMRDPATRNLAAALLAVRLPGAPTYAGPIDLALLDRALEPLRFDAATLTRLAGLARSEPGFLDPPGELAA